MQILYTLICKVFKRRVMRFETPVKESQENATLPLSIYIYIYIYIYKYNFAWEDERQKRCCIVDIAPQGLNSAILFVYRTGYSYDKVPEGFKMLVSALSALDKISPVT